MQVREELGMANAILESAVAKVNWLHLKGFGSGLSEEELGLLNSSSDVVKTRDGPWGNIFGIRNNGKIEEIW